MATRQIEREDRPEQNATDKDVSASRLTGMKDSAMAVARRARDFLTDQKEEVEKKAAESGYVPEEKYERTQDEARQKMQEQKLINQGVKDEAQQRAAADRDTAADRGIAARRNILGAIGSFGDAIKEKLTNPTDIVQEARASREYGGTKRGEKMVEDVQESVPAPASSPTMATSNEIPEESR